MNSMYEESFQTMSLYFPNFLTEGLWDRTKTTSLWQQIEFQWAKNSDQIFKSSKS